METTIDDARLKEILKQAILEILDERRELFSEVVMEALEDIAIAAAIKEGENTPLVSREDVFQLLEGESEAASYGHFKSLIKGANNHSR